LDVQDAVKHGYAWRAGEAPEPPEGESVINPSFEQPYEKQAGTAFVAAGWKYWYNEGDPPAETSQGPLAMPEYKEAPKAIDARRVSEGLSAQCWFIQYKVMDGGVRQLVPVTPGRRYRFTVDAQTWCSSSDTPTADDGEMYVSLGLDPLGRTDAKALGVVWSPWQRATNQHVAYQSQVVEATGPAMTVYVRAWNKWRLKHNDIYVDNVRWLEEGAPEIPEPPTPGECQALSAEQVEEIVRRVVREEIRGIQLQIALTCAGG